MGCERSFGFQFGWLKWFGFIVEGLGVVLWLRWGSVLQDFGISWSEVTGEVGGAQLDGMELKS